MQPNTSSFKHKTTAKTEKSRGKMKGRKEKRELGAEKAAQLRHHHHGQPVAAAVPGALRFASMLRRLLFLARGICYGVSVLGHFGPS